MDQNRRDIEQLRARGVVALYRDAVNPVMLEHSNINQARILILAKDDPAGTRQIIDEARSRNPDISIVAQAASEAERAIRRELNVQDVVLGEREVAAEMLRYTLHRFGVSGPELQSVVQGLRQEAAET